MSVEVVPINSGPSRRNILGPRFLYRWICLSLICCAIGWYLLSTRFTQSSFIIASTSNPIVHSIHEEIPFREASARFAGNLFPVDPNSMKTVLFWTSFFSEADARASLGQQLFAGCPVKQCEASGDRSKIDSADAVVFHAFDIDPHNLPDKRKESQHYVFLIGESPANIGDRIPETPDYFFDMIYSYRLNSDVLGHYTYSVPLETDARNFAKGKDKLIAWFVSNCKTPSRREDYVKQLQQFVSVDVYGKCGPLKCPRTNPDVCDKKLREEYKFYLSFENSICQDYVTEKFANALQNHVVPIVMGAGNMTIFPPHSYIHVKDFPTVKDLADYLQALDKNDTAYNEYHQWRRDKVLVNSHGPFSSANSNWCQLCERLHDPSYRSTGYKNVKQTYIEGGKCQSGNW